MQLFIEAVEVDINVGFSTMLTLAIDDIKDFGSRNTTFSKTIILPGTKRNNITFGNIFEVANGSTYDPASKNINYNFNAAVSAKAYIFDDNFQVFKGIIRMLEIVVDNGLIEYEVAVFGELGGFVAKVGNKKLEDLDFSALNHTLSVVNIAATWDTAAAGSGYYYPLMDYGTYSTAKKDWDYGTFRPALYVRQYIDKIFTAAGYTFNCALFDTTRFKGLVVPHNKSILTSNSSVQLNRTGAITVISDAVSGLVPFASGALGNFTTADNESFAYTGATGLMNISAEVNIMGYSSSPDNINIRLQKNGVNLNTVSTTGTGIISLLATGISLVATDIISIEINSIILNATLTFQGLSLSVESGQPALVRVNIGEGVKVNDTIPKNILQKDFISSVIKLFNLYVFEDYESDNVLKIMPFVDFYSLATSVDWSLKVDRSKPMRIKPMSELNSRYFNFTFKSDSDYYNDIYKKRYNQEYGSYKYDSNYEFAKESTDVQLIFSGTPLVGYAGEVKVYSTIFKRSGEVVGVGEEKIDSNIRILQAKKMTGVASWDIKNGATVLGSYTTYGYAGHFDNPDAPANDIQLGVPNELFFTLVSGAINVNQFTVYWSSYLAEITDKDSRLMSCMMRLSKKDIYKLDFSKLYWIDGILYRLNVIEDYNATIEDTCKVSFLKIINRIY